VTHHTEAGFAPACWAFTMHQRADPTTVCVKAVSSSHATSDSVRGGSDIAQLSLYCQLFRGLSVPSSQRPSPMCTEKQSVAGPKTSAVKVPTTDCVIRRRALGSKSHDKHGNHGDHFS
jgi:hypothetical protein